MPKNVLTDSDRHEKATIKFLKKLGFNNVNGGRNFFLGGRQVDAIATHEKTVLIIECTNQKNISSKIDAFRGRIAQIKSGLRSNKIYKNFNKQKFILVIKDQEVNTKIKSKANKGGKIFIWDEKFIEFHKQLESAIKIFAKYNLLSELGVKPEKNESIVVPAFAANVGKKKKYKLISFYIEADKLMSIAYVARREMGGETFYQRMVGKRRLRDIATNYLDGQNKVFPNSIVVALEDRSWNFTPLTVKDENNKILQMPDWQEFGRLTLGDTYNSCWIIDGQHRLFSHALASSKGKILVSAFANIGESDQAEYFLDINREAKRVDPELLWDLLGVIKEKSSEGRISNSVKSLRDMPGLFKKNIKIPSEGTGDYSFNNLCDSLKKTELGEKEIGFKYKKKKNPFWNENPSKHVNMLSKALAKYFSEIHKRIKSGIRDNLYSDGFVSVLIYIYKIFLVYTGKTPSVKQINDFSKILAAIFNSLTIEEATEIRKRLTSEGNKGEYRNDLVRYLQEKYNPNFGLGLFDFEPSMFEKIKSLELEFNKFIYLYLSKNLGADWFEKDEYFPNVQKRNQYKTRVGKEKLKIWEVLDLNVIIEVVTKNNLWEGYFKEIFLQYGFKTQEQLRFLTTMMMDFRSHDAHKRETVKVIPKAEKDFINLTYKSLGNLVKNESSALGS